MTTDADCAPPTISIIMPVRNAASDVANAVEMLSRQTFEDFEILAVDDGSTDTTRAILEGCARREPRLRVLRGAGPSGVASARNLAVSAARGEFVAFVDVDDEWTTTYIEVMARRILAGDVDCVVTNATGLIVATGETYAVSGIRSDGVWDRAEMVTAMLDGCVHGYLWDKMFTRRILGVDPFPPLRSRSDLAALIRIIGRCDAVAHLAAANYTYRVRVGSITNTRDPALADFLHCQDEMRRLIRDQPALDVSPLSCTHFDYLVALMIMNQIIRHDLTDDTSRALDRRCRDSVRLAPLIRLGIGGHRGLAGRLMLCKLQPTIYKRLYARHRVRRWTTRSHSA